MKTFYWHDYETFGADPSRDRPVQFAGIRTDEQLQPVGEPLEIFCRPTSDYLPHPEACLITGITPQLALSRGLSEAQFIARIHDQLAQPGTCGVGYNSIRFDDEVTRYTLYRNFYDPYAREWQAGNSRWDLIDVVRMCFALRPEGIEWPLNDAGVVSFKLERLTAANGIAHQGAHDALADVRATIALARLVRRCQPRLYDYALTLRDKRAVDKLISLPQARPLLHISSRYAASAGCAALVLPLARHPSNSNGVVVVDLAGDPEPLLALDVAQLQRRVFTPAAELGEGETRIGLKLVHLNRSPMLVTPKVLDEAGYQRLGIDPAGCVRHAERLQAALQAEPALAQKLGAVFDTSPPVDSDPETQLYAGFLPEADRRLLPQLRSAEATQLAAFGPRFRDTRLAPLLFRYRARNYPDTLSEEEREAWRERCRNRLADPVHGLTQHLALIDDKLADSGLAADQRSVLAELRAYALGVAAAYPALGTER